MSVNIINYSKFLILFLSVFFSCTCNIALAEDGKDDSKKNEKNFFKLREDSFFKNREFSIYFGSWMKHSLGKSYEGTEEFKNYALMVGMSIDDEKKTKFVVGTLKNSFGDRCILVGIQRDWFNITKNLQFAGMYAYVGQDPFGICESCGNRGAYEDFKKIFKVGFAPYIWHGLKYNVNDRFSVNAGFLIPGIFAATLEARF